MDLLNSLIGSVVTAVAGDKAPALNQFIESNGGVNGLSEKFRSGGMAETFSSWVSTGDNAAITAQQVQAVMGNAQVQEMARKMGVDPAMASDFIAKALPQVIDQLTPQGKLN
jgi:uncharacterized protein YidB (DUF937 family)